MFLDRRLAFHVTDRAEEFVHARNSGEEHFVVAATKIEEAVRHVFITRQLRSQARFDGLLAVRLGS